MAKLADDMYSFKNISSDDEQMIGLIVSNEAKRAAHSLKRERKNLEYQRENMHIFLHDGTINATERKIKQLESQCAAVNALLAAITIR